MSSFQSQYGIRLSRELVPGGMKWDEFRDLLVGIAPDTALGRIVAIRAENDPKALKRMTTDQRRIRSDWLKKQAQKIPEQEAKAAIEGFKKAFLAAAGINLDAVGGASGT